MKKEMKFLSRWSRLLSRVLVFVFLFSFGVFPVQAQDKECTYRTTAVNCPVCQVQQMKGQAQIYEFLLDGQVVMRYRSMYNGLSAKERAEIILNRAKKMGQDLKEGKIEVKCINGCYVVTIDGEVFITVTEADCKANKSTPQGLACIWAQKLKEARNCNKVIIPEKPKVTPPQDQEPKEDTPAPEETNNAETTIASAEEQKMLELINAERAKVGAKPLIMKPELVKIARLKSQDMIEKNYFSHTSPTYGDPFTMLKNFGISYRYAGENLAGNPSVENAHKSLMNSPGHRQNILNPNYTHIGIGIVNGGPYGKICTQLFIGE